MGYFENKIDTLMRSGKGTEEKTRGVIAVMDAHIFEPMMHTDPNRYWKMMRKIHEIYEGCHYDKEFAIWEVEQMQHTDKSGVIHKGVHWTMSDIEQVYMKYQAHFKPTDNIFDVYVALHSWWHDNICQDMADFGDNAEVKNIERAIVYFFKDEDAPEGKIWHYYKGMRKRS